MSMHTVELNGQKYNISYHPGEEGLEVGAYVSSLLSPVALQMQFALEEGDSDKPLADLSKDKQDKIRGAMGDLLKALPAKELLALCKTAFAYTRLEGEAKPLADKVMFDTHFRGNYKALIPLLKAVIEYNGFLDLNVLGLLQ